MRRTRLVILLLSDFRKVKQLTVRLLFSDFTFFFEIPRFISKAKTLGQVVGFFVLREIFIMVAQGKLKKKYDFFKK